MRLILFVAFAILSLGSYGAVLPVPEGVDPQLLWIIGVVIVLSAGVAIVWTIERKHKALQAAHDALRYRDAGKETVAADKSTVTMTVKADTSSMKSALEQAARDVEAFSSGVMEKLEGVARATAKAQENASAALPATGALAAAYIDRDDFMKAIGTDFPQPVSLDGKLVHNGMGEVLAYVTDASNGQITLFVAKAPA